MSFDKQPVMGAEEPREATNQDSLATMARLRIERGRKEMWHQREKADDHFRIALELLSASSRQEERLREGIYVASRASIPERGQMWRDLRASGVKINSSWIDEDGEGETADWSELWSRIEREVKQSTALVLYAEPTDFPLKGAFVEAGIAIAAGVPIFIVAPDVELGSYGCRPIGSWASHPLVTFADSVEQAARAALEPPHAKDAADV